MSVVKTTFTNGRFLHRRVMAEFENIRQAFEFCDAYIHNNMSGDQMCEHRSNGWTVYNIETDPGWFYNGELKQKIYSLKIVEVNLFAEVIDELRGKVIDRSDPIDIPAALP